MYLVFNKVMVKDQEVARINKIYNSDTGECYHCININPECDLVLDDMLNLTELFKQYIAKS